MLKMDWIAIKKEATADSDFTLLCKVYQNICGMDMLATQSKGSLLPLEIFSEKKELASVG